MSKDLTDEALARAVAEEVMGFWWQAAKGLRVPGGGKQPAIAPGWIDPNSGHYYAGDWCVNWSSAGRVLERMRELGWGIQLVAHPTGSGLIYSDYEALVCEGVVMEDSSAWSTLHFARHLTSGPRAIFEVALAAVRAGKETP